MSRSEGGESLFPQFGIGLGLRPPHYLDILSEKSDKKPISQWFEAVSENYLAYGGQPLNRLEKVREKFPIALHGVSLSIGSADPLNTVYLKKLKSLIKRFDPIWVSDHLCWTGVDGQNLHDLMPIPFTEEAVRHVTDRILQVQDYLGRRLVLENVSSYFNYRQSEMTEWEFLTEVSNRADCGLLLDLNNVYVSSVNHGFDPETFLAGVPARRIAQLHLAGHSTRILADGSKILIDTHDHPVCDEVWQLLDTAVQLWGPRTMMIEWDADIPEYSVLEQELKKAKTIEEQALGKSKLEFNPAGPSDRDPRRNLSIPFRG